LITVYILIIKKYTKYRWWLCTGSMKLTESELKCVRAIATMGNARTSEIATAIHVARPNVSRAVASLEAKGFVEAKRDGISSFISLSDAKHAVLWKKLAIQFAHMPLDRLLAGARPAGH
jgi:DNA-binding MarR family transcriptional regulator